MRKLTILACGALLLLGACRQPEQIPQPTPVPTTNVTEQLRHEVLMTQDGTDKVADCETIGSTVSQALLDQEGWTMDECYKAYLP